ncbi:VpaChn25_0724 family phage protein [Bosea thiooxidans]
MDVIRSQHRRLVILRLLERQPCYRSNERVIADCLHDFALSGADVEVRACFEFLEQSGLVSNSLHEGVLISSLTQAGQEFLDGYTIVEGVYRPRPGSTY